MGIAHKAICLVLFYTGFVHAQVNDQVKDRVHEQINPIHLWMAPTLGGTEGGIPGLNEILPSQKTNLGHYFARLPNRKVSANAPTHLIVIARGEKSGLLFQLAGVARLRKLAELFPQDDVVLLSVEEIPENIEIARSWGLDVFARFHGPLDIFTLNRRAKAFRAIASLDVFSHSNPEYGARIDNQDYLGTDEYRLDQLAQRFTADAFAIFHGCNSGWRLAPSLARRWRIPVAGSFTGTHFEHLHSQKQFFPYDLEFAPEGPFVNENTLSYDRTVDCLESGCVRMKPDPHVYSGQWGQKDSGLNFYKFFCPTQRSLADCQKRMALSIAGYLTTKNAKHQSDEDIILELILDFMCPIHKNRAWRENCTRSTKKSLAKGTHHYSPFLGRSVQCDMQNCRDSRPGEPTTTYMNEIRHYLRGFQKLRNSNTHQTPTDNGQQ